MTFYSRIDRQSPSPPVNPVLNPPKSPDWKKIVNFEYSMKPDELMRLQFKAECRLFRPDLPELNTSVFQETGKPLDEYMTVRTVFYNYRHVDNLRCAQAGKLVRELLRWIRPGKRDELVYAALCHYLESHINRYLEALSRYPDSQLFKPSMLEMYLALHLIPDQLKQENNQQKGYIEFARTDCGLREDRPVLTDRDLDRLSTRLDKWIEDLETIARYASELNRDEPETERSVGKPGKEEMPEMPDNWFNHVGQTYRKFVHDTEMFENGTPEKVQRTKRQLDEIDNIDDLQGSPDLPHVILPDSKRLKGNTGLVLNPLLSGLQTERDLLDDLKEVETKLDGLSQQKEELLSRSRPEVDKTGKDREIVGKSVWMSGTHPLPHQKVVQIVVPVELKELGFTEEDLIQSYLAQKEHDELASRTKVDTVSSISQEMYSEPWDNDSAPEETTEVPFEKDPLIDNRDEPDDLPSD